MNKKQFTFGSLFAGIGGFELGFEKAGMHCVWQVEIDSKCNEVLAHHWPRAERHGDVKDVGKRNLEPVDLVCGGFPCQDVSVAGRREGLAGERSGLWFEFIRIVEELAPKWVVVENVPGLLSSNEKRDFAAVLSGLGECGYWWAYRVLDAQYYGVPQRRRRVFVVGCLGRECAQEVLFERESSPWDTPPSRKTGKKTASYAVSGIGDYREGKGILRRHGGDCGGGSEILTVVGPLDAGAADRPNSHGYAGMMSACNQAVDAGHILPVAFTHSGYSNKPAWITGERTDAIPAAGHHPSSHQGIGIIECIAFDRTRSTVSGLISGPLRVQGSVTPGVNPGKADAQCVAYGIGENQRAEVCLTPYNRALKTGGGKLGQGYPCVLEIHGGSKRKDRPEGGFYIREMPSTKPLDTSGLNPNCAQGGELVLETAHRGANQTGVRQGTTYPVTGSQAVLQKMGVRRLTPLECERLQGFPDNWTAVNGMSDSARYRTLGNAVCVPVAEWIGRRILEAEERWTQ